MFLWSLCGGWTVIGARVKGNGLVRAAAPIRERQAKALVAWIQGEDGERKRQVWTEEIDSGNRVISIY